MSQSVFLGGIIGCRCVRETQIESLFGLRRKIRSQSINRVRQRGQIANQESFLLFTMRILGPAPILLYGKSCAVNRFERDFLLRRFDLQQEVTYMPTVIASNPQSIRVDPGKSPNPEAIGDQFSRTATSISLMADHPWAHRRKKLLPVRGIH